MRRVITARRHFLSLALLRMLAACAQPDQGDEPAATDPTPLQLELASARADE